MNRSRFAPRAALLGVLLLCGCPRKKESPEYVEAHTLFTHLYAEKLDDAYVDPQMARIEQLLQRVPANSLDAAGAQTLLKQIQDNRARMEKEAIDSAKAIAEASKPTADVPWTRKPDAVVEDAGAPAVEAPPDAGPSMPTEGMLLAEFAQRFSRCFRPTETINVEGQGAKNRWDLFDVGNCRDLYPSFVGTVILTDDRSIWRIVPASSIVRKPATVDAGPPPPVKPPLLPSPPVEDAGSPEGAAPPISPADVDAGSY